MRRRCRHNIEQCVQYVVPRNERFDMEYNKGIYRVHQRVAKTFRRARVLLAGNAAYLNNSIGGFGMNARSMIASARRAEAIH